jgi:Rrf2 family protein
MKLSTNSRYGLRAMVDLAANYAGDPVSLRDIAERQRISMSYLEQAFATLRKAGLVRSAKGAQGGYVPVENPENLYAGTILRALEGDLSIIEDSPTYAGADPFKRCIKENIWDAIDKSISQIVDSVTLADLAEEYRRMRGNALEDMI